MKKQKLLFRSWFYFRTGWGSYFAFMLGAINTLTVTYYLAIEKVPQLKEIFPTFVTYVMVAVIIVIPTLTLVGYIHFKKSGSYKAEADIGVEANPYWQRLIQNSELVIVSYTEILDLLTKLSLNKKLTDEEINRISNIKKELKDYSLQKTLK